MMLLRRALLSLRNRSATAARQLRGLSVQALGYCGLAALGRRPSVGRTVRLTIYGELIVGDNVLFDDGCFIYVGPNARIAIGNNVVIGRGTVIAAAQSVEIGDHVLIAEHCTIRDSDHHLQPEERRYETSAVSEPVVVGADAWIGAGARILRGSQIGAGAVVGANAVVTGPIPPRSIAVGVPARVVKTL
jgi:acetyltransferase-like isoleucine patch superfamily enzyme